MSALLITWFPYIGGFAALMFVVTFWGFYRETHSMSLTWLRMLSLAKHLLRLKQEAKSESESTAPKKATNFGTISSVAVPDPRTEDPRTQEKEM